MLKLIDLLSLLLCDIGHCYMHHIHQSERVAILVNVTNCTTGQHIFDDVNYVIHCVDNPV